MLGGCTKASSGSFDALLFADNVATFGDESLRVGKTLQCSREIGAVGDMVMKYLEI